MSSFLYNSAKKKLMDGSIDMDTDTIKVALTDASYVPDMDAHVFFSDISHEIVGTGYTAGGMALTGKAVSQDNTNNRGVFDADDASWPTSTITNARYAVIYKSTGVAGTSPLVAVIDLLTNKSSVGDTFKIEWDAAGIFYLA